MPLSGPTTATLHHVSHEPLGSDEIMNVNASHLTSGVLPDARLSINVLKFTGGYPGGITNFLRSDGTFNAPSGGSGSLPTADLGQVLISKGVSIQPIFSPDPKVTSISLGTNSAQSGAVRLANGEAIFSRNAANTADLRMFICDNANDIAFGTTTNPGTIQFHTANDIYFFMAGSSMVMSGTYFVPLQNNRIQLGGDGYAWSQGWFSGNVNAGGLGSTPLNASNLTSGTVPDARLSSNIAFKNQSNTFILDNTFNSWTVFKDDITLEEAEPGFWLIETDQGIDQKNWRFVAKDAEFSILPITDAWSDINTGMRLARDGTLYVFYGVSTRFLSASGDLAVAGNANVTMSGGNVALKNAANVFTEDQKIEKTIPRLFLRDTSRPANEKLFNIVNSNSKLTVYAIDDSNTVIQSTPLTLNRDGSIIIGGRLTVGTDLITTQPIYPGRLDTGWTQQGSWYLASHGSYGLYSNTGFYATSAIYSGAHIVAGSDFFEKSRTTALGHWISFTPVITTNAGTATISSNFGAKYSLSGKTITVAFYLGLTFSSTPTIVYIAIPGGFVAGPVYMGGSISADPGASQYRLTPGSVYIELIRNIQSSVAWPTGLNYVAGTAIFEIV